ncbi:unnamed protein product [Thelazia callipaeda]|uniref:DUF148 domain-containing protein n=1 Tax=Thelazia callipaeda TaxID=103827 RepID=A0A0N5D0P7_THECL|nr:unnamed protein product [Thelazia callipaeda]
MKIIMVVVVCISHVLCPPLRDLPGYSDLGVRPELATSSKFASFVLGRASKPVHKHAFIEVPLPDGKVLQVPKGIYHYSERSQHFDTDAAIPQLERPFQAFGSHKTHINNVNGVYLPLPFGMDPINLQFITEQTKGGSLTSDVKSGIDGRVRQALNDVRKKCFKMVDRACELALTKYYEARAMQIEQDDTTLQEKLLQMGTDVITELGSKTLDYNGLGVLVGMPGIEPVYLGAGMDRSADSLTEFDMSLPY